MPPSIFFFFLKVKAVCFVLPSELHAGDLSYCSRENKKGSGRGVVHTFGKGRNRIVSICRQHGLLHIRSQKLQKT